ncbi:MAG: hypothetical protein JKX89_06315 [Idiomarina sp.]|nr:hypothetical protein [Idiomarina sp.]
MIELYFLVSVFVGIAVIVDGVVLYKAKGVCWTNKIQSFTTTIEFLWVIVSIITFFTLELSHFQILIPSLYVVHNIFGWAYGSYLVSKSPEVKNGIEALVVPYWYLIFGMTVGIVFSISSLYALILL